ncbi:hypothetical protein [Paraburkholderia unamae]|uniref:hypothetical protein n=1 Tax=Paraburkholderia unamae TaxID=219649 RepID=UPI001057D266|nr:hypothetical protein [Paraburkholderia unamae]
MKRWLIRCASVIAGLVILATASGNGYEAYDRHQAQKAFPAPEEVVDIGGRGIQLDCRGAGSPTVVFAFERPDTVIDAVLSVVDAVRAGDQH